MMLTPIQENVVEVLKRQIESFDDDDFDLIMQRLTDESENLHACDCETVAGAISTFVDFIETLR